MRSRPVQDRAAHPNGLAANGQCSDQRQTDDDTGVDVYAWTSVIARSTLPANIKLIAFTVTTFANGNGSRVFPGISRLVVRSGFSRSTVSRALKYLKDLGLIELVRAGNRRRGRADEYRLIFAPDLMDRLDLRSLEDEAAEVEAENERHRTASSSRQSKHRSTVSIMTVEQVPPEPPEPVDNSPEPAEKTITSTVTALTHETRFYGQTGPRSTVTALTPHLRIEHLPRKQTYGSSMAGDLTSPSTARPIQLPLLASIDDERPDYPVDANQLALVDLPPPELDPERAAMWPVLQAQLARINHQVPAGAIA